VELVCRLVVFVSSLVEGSLILDLQN